MQKQDHIERMRKALKSKIEDLDSMQAPDSEEARLGRTLDAMRLDFRKDEKGKSDEEEISFLYINSAARDRALYPSPGQYRVQLDTEINNIIKAQLVQASFPVTDPTVNETNQELAFSFAPHNAPVTVRVPTGSYTGEQLAVEITRQMNMSLFSAQLLAGSYRIEDDTGLAKVVATGLYAPAQFRVSFNANSRRFAFQYVDADLQATNSPFAMHVQPLPTASSQPWTSRNSDLYSLLGFDRDIVQAEGALDPGSGTYYLLNTTPSANFGPAASPDQREAYSVRGNQTADLRGGMVVVLDIDKLNDGDVIFTTDGPDGRFKVGACFGYLPTRDPAFVQDAMLDFNSNGSPIVKEYRNGRSRINQLLVTLRRPDGTINDFGGLDHFMAIKLTLKRTQPNRPMFGR